VFLDRLQALDERIASTAAEAVSADIRDALLREVEDELSPFRSEMPAERLEKASAAALDRRVRAHLGLPVLRYS
jgi:hypothetical protein